MYRVYRLYRLYTAGAGHCQAPSAGARVGALGDRGDSAGARAERGKLRHAVRLARRMLGRGWCLWAAEVDIQCHGRCDATNNVIIGDSA